MSEIYGHGEITPRPRIEQVPLDFKFDTLPIELTKYIRKVMLISAVFIISRPEIKKRIYFWKENKSIWKEMTKMFLSCQWSRKCEWLIFKQRRYTHTYKIVAFRPQVWGSGHKRGRKPNKCQMFLTLNLLNFLNGIFHHPFLEVSIISFRDIKMRT